MLSPSPQAQALTAAPIDSVAAAVAERRAHCKLTHSRKDTRCAVPNQTRTPLLSYIQADISFVSGASGHTIALVWCTPGPHVDRPLVLVNTYFRTCCSKGAALRASRARRARQHYRDFTKKKPSLSVRRRYKSCLVGSDRWQCHYFSFCMRAWHMQMVHPRDQGYISQLLNCQR